MKKKIILLCLLLGCGLAGMAAQADQAAFEKAKLLIFDKQWAAALTQLDEIIDRHSGSRFRATALFYRGKCQAELGKAKPALASYEKFVAEAGGSNLAEEALISIADLAAGLVEAGEKSLLPKLLDLLGNENRVVSYYAAFKVSYLPDRKTAARALPVLQAVLDNEKDEELRDRAKIAIMRIDPARLKAMDKQHKSLADRLLKIRVFDKQSRKEKISLSIPLALADLALKALSAEQKRTMQKQGYNLDDLLNRVTSQGTKIDIQGEDEVIQIWVD